MARPTNEHHVHSDGYYSDKGESDSERMLVELADEIEGVDGVEAVYPQADWIEVEYDDSDETYEVVSDLAEQWDCQVTSDASEWLEIQRW